MTVRQDEDVVVRGRRHLGEHRLGHLMMGVLAACRTASSGPTKSISCGEGGPSSLRVSFREVEALRAVAAESVDLDR